MPYKSCFWCTEKRLKSTSLCVPSLQFALTFLLTGGDCVLPTFPSIFYLSLSALMCAFLSPSPSEESEITGFSWSAPWRVPNPSKLFRHHPLLAGWVFLLEGQDWNFSCSPPTLSMGLRKYHDFRIKERIFLLFFFSSSLMFALTTLLASVSLISMQLASHGPSRFGLNVV